MSASPASPEAVDFARVCSTEGTSPPWMIPVLRPPWSASVASQCVNVVMDEPSVDAVQQLGPRRLVCKLLVAASAAAVGVQVSGAICSEVQLSRRG